MKDTKQVQAEEVARMMKSAMIKCQKAIDLMHEYDLNLENYPEYWHDFEEHPSELWNIFVSDFNGNTQVMVGEV